MALKFSKEYFPKYDISDLLINIWSYKDPAHEKCDICKTYEKGAWNQFFGFRVRYRYDKKSK